VLSAPNGARLANALANLELVISLDIYLNETTRHADVILPAPSPLRRPHYDLALYQLACRNVANYSPAVLEPSPDLPDEWVTLLRLTGIVTGQGPDADVEALDGFVARAVAAREGGDRPAEDVLAAVAPRVGPERLLDILLRAGPYGDGFGTRPGGLTLEVLDATPHGVDLGALEPRIPDVLRTASGTIELAPAPVVDDVPRLRGALGRRATGGLVLVGRRDQRSNNSWMHNLPLLVSGPERCTLHMHPDDAARLGVEDGAPACVTSRTGELVAPVAVTDAVMPGVVSLPHGWGHDAPDTELAVAGAHAGVNSNALGDDSVVDAVSGNAVLNGIPVEVAPVATAAPVPA
jgi:anaerobic selenocysteine-containing dehydrogenase